MINTMARKGRSESHDCAIGYLKADAKVRWICLCVLLSGNNGLCEAGSGVSAPERVDKINLEKWPRSASPDLAVDASRR